ncbi:hypothetical protein PTKIN_Ptkin17bG0108500 [Pterospermum kingtungense]
MDSLASSALPLTPFSGHSLRRKKANIKISASKKDAYSPNFDDNLVDESMVVLRKRIHEMRMLEMRYEPPQHWMEWEKQYKRSNNYDCDVCEAVGYLQAKLMETRPSLALGMGALLLLSVPTSMAVVLFHMMAMMKGL